MRLRWFSLPAAALSVGLTACTNTGSSTASNPGGTGPFDSRGNYVEAWADSPGKWKEGSRQIADAEPDTAPAADIPVIPPPVLAANVAPKPVSTTTTVVYKKPANSSSSVASQSTKPKASSKPVVVKPKTRPKPKAIAKTKAKPKATRHTVRSGDSLYAIAKRYGTTIGAVQRANGIKGAMIKPGQALVIPK